MEGAENVGRVRGSWSQGMAAGQGACRWSQTPQTLKSAFKSYGNFQRPQVRVLVGGGAENGVADACLVGRPQVVLLDEVWSAMDESMVSAARNYLREGGVGEDQAVVVITHWEDEVPWSVEEGVKRFQLTKGEGEVVT